MINRVASSNDLVSTTPRGGIPTSPRQLADLISHQKQLREGLFLNGNKFKQDDVNNIWKTLRNAANAGARHAVVQTLHLATQYGYHRGSGEKYYIVHDVHTMQPVAGCKTFIVPSEPVMELILWMRDETHCTVKFATQVKQEGREDGTLEPVLANYMHLVACFLPEIPPGFYNGPYLSRSLDAGMVTHWNEICARALRAGAMHAVITVLQHQRDFTLAAKGTLRTRWAHSMEPTNKYTAVLVMASCSHLFSWCTKQLQYEWCLAIPKEQEDDSFAAPPPAWAYFVVLFDPCSDKY
jgi:hypothetical protein